MPNSCIISRSFTAKWLFIRQLHPSVPALCSMYRSHVPVPCTCFWPDSILLALAWPCLWANLALFVMSLTSVFAAELRGLKVLENFPAWKKWSCFTPANISEWVLCEEQRVRMKDIKPWKNKMFCYWKRGHDPLSPRLSFLTLHPEFLQGRRSHLLLQLTWGIMSSLMNPTLKDVK